MTWTDSNVEREKNGTLNEDDTSDYQADTSKSTANGIN